MVEEMMSKCNLIYLNDGQPTRRNSNSVIDLVLSSAGLVQYSKECSTLSHEQIRSDHIAAIYEATLIELIPVQNSELCCQSRNLNGEYGKKLQMKNL